MPIAILGWGSLLWEGREFDAQHDHWRLNGPTVPLEFSRISQTRLGALTLVIDRVDGSPCQVAWCQSIRADASAAIDDLKTREGTSTKRIALIDVEGPPPVPGSIEASIRQWAIEVGIRQVIWTALPPNFADKVGMPYSVANAIIYLGRLTPEGKAKAREYLDRAPGFVATALRMEYDATGAGLAG